MNREQRRQKLRQLRDEQRAAEREATPLPDNQLRALFDVLDEKLAANSCDHSLRFTRAFLSERGVESDEVLSWLAGHGGGCDCEVLANVEERWLEARGEA